MGASPHFFRQVISVKTDPECKNLFSICTYTGKTWAHLSWRRTKGPCVSKENCEIGLKEEPALKSEPFCLQPFHRDALFGEIFPSIQRATGSHEFTEHFNTKDNMLQQSAGVYIGPNHPRHVWQPKADKAHNGHSIHLPQVMALLGSNVAPHRWHFANQKSFLPPPTL